MTATAEWESLDSAFKASRQRLFDGFRTPFEWSLRHLPYDMDCGAVGYGWAYLCFPDEYARELSRTFESCSQLPTVLRRLRSQKRPDKINIGVPHGLAGALHFFSLAQALNIKPRVSKSLLDTCLDTLEWSLEEIERPQSGARLPGFAQKRMSWCGSAVGIAAALEAAFQRVGNATLRTLSEDFLNLRPSRTQKLDSPYLCHGSAGVSYTLERLSLWQSESTLADESRNYLAQTKQLLRSRPRSGALFKKELEKSILFSNYGAVAAVETLAKKRSRRWDFLLYFNHPRLRI